MELNVDFSQRAVMHAASIGWIPSPIAGVDRRMLDRIGDEVARATSIVRYAPNSQFTQQSWLRLPIDPARICLHPAW